MDTVLPPQLDVASFGEFLRRARERRGLTLEQISDETKIPRRHLDALEHGNLAAIPGGMYQRAEIRAYAHVVGLDESLALTQLELALKTTQSSDPEPRERIPVEEWISGGRGLTALAVVAMVAIALVVSWQGQPTPQAATPLEEAEAAVPSHRDASPPAAAVDTPAIYGSPDDTGDQPAIGAAAAAVPRAVDQPDSSNATSPTAPVAEPAPPVDAAAPAMPVETGAAEAPESPGGAARASGRVLEVVTDPPGARVLVNGIGRGSSPVAVRFLPAGRVQVRVVKDGFASEERSVVVAGNATTTATFSLQPLELPTTP